MTPEERAEEVVDKWVDGLCDVHDVRELVANAIRQAIADETEARASPTESSPGVAAKIREIHQLLKRGENTEDHGVIGNLDCIYDHLAPMPSIFDDPTPPAARDGFVRVPRIPTDKMIFAAQDECHRMRGVIDPVMHIWDVMLAAAPQSWKKNED